MNKQNRQYHYRAQMYNKKIENKEIYLIINSF